LKTLLIGLGNLIMGDEGIGVQAINAIRQRYSFEPPVEVVDGGTLGLDLLSYFEQRDAVVIVDAVNFGKEPGYIGLLRDDEVPAQINTKLTVHHIGLSDILSSLKLLGKSPKRITLVGIQPESIEFSLNLSSTLKARFQELIETTIKEIEEMGHRCVLQFPQR
jgi:hydrogenase maturation protease